MGNNLILPDGIVQGSISGNGTDATVNAEVSCDGIVPKGTLSGTIRYFDGQFTQTVGFSSEQAFIVATLLNSGLESVGAWFTNVTVENLLTGNQSTSDCQAFLNATRLTSNSWIGALTITCPDDRKFFIYGVFTGEVDVNREVFCRPLL